MHYLEIHTYVYLTVSTGISTDTSIYFVSMCVYTYLYIPAHLTYIMVVIILGFSNVISLLLSLLSL